MRVIYLICSILFVAGCVPYPRSSPAYADFCDRKIQLEKNTPEGKKTFYLYVYLHDRDLYAAEQDKQLGEFKGKVFYVQLIGFNKNRSIVSKANGHEEAPIPMYYSPEKAYIELEDGQKIAANKIMYLSGASFDMPVSKKPIEAGKFDLNSDLVHKNIPERSKNNKYGSVFVIFNTSLFNPQSKWNVDLGEIDLDGEVVKIPPLKLCNTPRKTWIGLEPLMRP